MRQMKKEATSPGQGQIKVDTRNIVQNSKECCEQAFGVL